MIRINLLPYRSSKKKETAAQQLIMLGIAIALALGVVSAVYFITLSKIKSAKEEITQSENDLLLLKKKIGEIDNLKKLQLETQKKLDILNQLRKEKTGPATRLARICDIVPEKMWITRYQETGVKVSISGVSHNEDLIADFMRSLNSSPEFEGVDLQVSEQMELNGQKLKKFDLTCNIKVALKPEPTKEPGKK